MKNDRLIGGTLEDEGKVLGGLIGEPEQIKEIFLFLNPSDFDSSKHQLIYKTLLMMHKNNISISLDTIAKELDKKVSASYLSEIAWVCPDLKYWVDRVGDASNRRKIHGILRDEANRLGQEETHVIKDRIIERLNESLPLISDLSKFKPYTLSDLQEDIRKTPEGLETGYKELDKYMRIPQGAITIIAGRPSHGKTTFLMNLCLKMVDLYSSKFFLFFSYEETQRQVGLKLLNILSGEVISEHQNLYQLENYERGNNNGNPSIEGGKNRFKELTESGRLCIIDKPYFVDELASIMSEFNDRYAIGAVFIDYIQKVKIKDRYSTRQIELQKISEQILETAKRLSLPVILGAQLGREKQRKDKVYLDNLREAGDIEQDAHLVLGLHNPAMEKAQDAMEGTQDKGEPLIDRKVELTITILKQRNGIVNIEVPLDFDRPILTIKDRDSKGSW